MKNSWSTLVVAIALPFLQGCGPVTGPGPYISIAGFTQGTSYHITYQAPGSDSVNYQPEIDTLLHRFDLSLSTYVPHSVISRVNRNEPHVVDTLFREVFREAERMYELTGGAFDITVGPLIDAWGFGPGERLDPDSAMIDSLLQFVGMDKVTLEENRIKKAHPNVRLDVNAIAQGYAVDVVTRFLDEKGVSDYMVEIGGEIRTRGRNDRGVPWRIGIDKPAFGNQIPGRELQRIVAFSDRSLASSGNYRKYYETDGKKIVHTVDPRSGYTRMTRLLSATIITGQCMTADAIATSCMVLGVNKGRELVESMDDVEAYFIYSDDSGLYMEWYSDGMETYLE